MADILDIFGGLSGEQQDEFIKSLSDQERQDLITELSSQPQPSPVPAPAPGTYSNERGFMDELTDGGAAISDIQKAGSSALEFISDLPSRAQRGPLGLTPQGLAYEAGVKASPSIAQAGEQFGEMPTSQKAELALKLLAQGAVGVASGPFAPVTMPIAGTGIDYLGDLISGDVKSGGKYGKQLRQDLTFEGLGALAGGPIPKTATRLAQSGGNKLKYAARKFVTGEGDPAIDVPKSVQQPGSTATALGGVDRNRGELAASTDKLNAEEVLVNERIIQDVDMSEGRPLLEISEEIGSNIQNRLSAYQQMEDRLLSQAADAGATIPVSDIADPRILRAIVDEGPYSDVTYPITSRLSKAESRIATTELSPIEANAFLKEIQSALKKAGKYDQKNTTLSAQEAQRVELLTDKLGDIAKELSGRIDSKIAELPDVAQSPGLPTFQELNRRQHELLFFVEDFPEKGYGNFLTRRAGAKEPSRIADEQSRSMNTRLSSGGSIIMNAQDAAGMLIDKDIPASKRLRVDKDTYATLRAAQQGAKLAEGSEVIPPSKASTRLQEAGEAYRSPELRKRGVATGLGISTAEEVSDIAAGERASGISPEEALQLFNSIPLFSPAEANATPLEGNPAAIMGALEPVALPRDPDVIATDPRLVEQLMMAVQPNTALLLEDAMRSKDPMKRRLAFSQAFQEAPDMFEDSVTGARSEIRVGDNFVLGDPREAPLIIDRWVSRYKQGEIPSDLLAEQISALNDPTDQRLLPEPPVKTLEQELRAEAARQRPQSPLQALKEAAPKRIKTAAGERRMYGSSGGASGDLGKPVNDNAKEVATALKQRGYTKAAIAGILGNLEVETGGSFDYKQEQVKGPAVGLFQFDFMKPYYRKWLKKTGYDDSLDAQVEYVDRVIKGTEPMLGSADRRALQKAVTLDDPVKVAELFSNHFLKPGKPHLSRRKEAAQRFAALLSQDSESVA